MFVEMYDFTVTLEKGGGSFFIVMYTTQHAQGYNSWRELYLAANIDLASTNITEEEEVRPMQWIHMDYTIYSEWNDSQMFLEQYPQTMWIYF